MSKQTPKVSIGLPVYNGEEYLAEAVESVLGQTFQDLELIISDNGSTDRTEEICRAFVQKDERVHYYRSEKNFGASWNYNRTFELAKGDYFRWHAADDVLTSELVEKSSRVLDEQPAVVLVFSWVVDIDGHGKEIELKKSGVGSRLPLPHQRFQGLSTVKPDFNCEEVFGMARRQILAKTKLIAPYSDSDRTLLAELGLYGPFHEIEEALFLHRLHDDGSVVVNPDRQSRTVWFDTAKKDKLVFPSWRQLGELLSVIWRTPIGWRERLYCYFHMLTWVKRRRRHLRRDLVWAIKQFS